METKKSRSPFHILSVVFKVMCSPIVVGVIVAVLSLALLGIIFTDDMQPQITLENGDTRFALGVRDVFILPEGTHSIWAVSRCGFTLEQESGETTSSENTKPIPMPDYSWYHEIRTTVTGGETIVVSHCQWEELVYIAIEGNVEVVPTFHMTGTPLPLLENGISMNRFFRIAFSAIFAALAYLSTELVHRKAKQNLSKR